MNIANSQKSVEPRNDVRRFSGDPLIGTIIDGRFQIEELLGIGGTSIVYKAKQLCVNRSVALKTLKFQIGDRPSLGERFQREINSLITLNHPNIVTIYDCIFDEEDQPFIVMDYLRGRSLDRLLLEEGNLPLEKFLTVILQIFSAVEHAHKKGIVHRDLKPGNIVLVDDEMNFVKVVDFGLAKLGEESRKITRSGELWGSPPYMSPEQCIGEPVDERSDIYSLGAVMFEMLSGREPFTAETIYELIQMHLLYSPPPIANGNPEISISPQLEKVVLKALSKSPDNRYQSISELRIAVLNACSVDVNRDSGTRIEAIATHVGSTNDLLTYVNAMAPYAACVSDTTCDDDTVCDTGRTGVSWCSLRAGFWTSIGLFLVSLVAACFYVIGTVDGIRSNAENRIGSSAANASSDHVMKENTFGVKGSLPPNSVLHAKALSTVTRLKASPVQSNFSVLTSSQLKPQSHPAAKVRTPIKPSRANVRQAQSSTDLQQRKPPVVSRQSRDPWATLDGLRSR